MANFTPMTTIQLLQNVPLKPDNEHQLYFDNITAQDNYFTGKLYQSSTNFTYQREHRKIDMQGNYSDIVDKCNYLRYKNANYSNKWYYAFIISVEYVNPNTVRIDYEIDSYQTFMFDLVWKNCFIEREHVTDDTIGANTIDENLECGQIQYKEVDEPTDSPYIDEYGNYKMCTIILMTEPYGSDGTTAVSYNYINGICTPLSLWCSVSNDIETWASFWQASRIMHFQKFLSDNGKASAMYGSYAVPLFAVRDAYFNTINNGNEYTGWYLYSQDNTQFADMGSYLLRHYNLTKPKFNGYTPKNNKLYTYPYFYVLIDNNQGNQGILKPEFMDKNGGTFNFDARIYTNCLPDCTMYFKVMNYGINSPNAYTYSIAKMPMIPTKTSFYENWLAGNRASLQGQIVSNAFRAANGAITSALGNLSGAGQINDTLSNMLGLYGQVRDMEIKPDSSSGSIASTAVISSGKLRFNVNKCYIKGEIAERIDNFFTMYGYKVNKLATPQFHTRKYYNYLKLTSVAIYGNVPQEHIEKITNIFKRGVTLWHSNDVGNYRNGDNPIL